MIAFGYLRIFSVIAACLFLFAPVFTYFARQGPQPSPSSTPAVAASPSASMTPSPSPTRAPTPTPTPLPGAKNFHQWGSITVFNGLPSDSIRAIAQSHDGLMWFGTDNGLARFDGRRVQNFSLTASDAVRVQALRTDQEGRLWIGTQNGAFIHTGGRFQPIPGTDGLGITAILITQEIYLATDAGLVLIATMSGSGEIAAEPMFPDPILGAEGNVISITSLVQHDGRLLAGTYGKGVFVLDKGSRSQAISRPLPAAVSSLAVAKDTGKLWIGTTAAKGVSGIHSLAAGSRTERFPAPTADVLVLEANENGVWAGTERYGLFQVTDKKVPKMYTFENTSGGLRSDAVYALFTDREGVLWIGTNRGVSRFDVEGPFQETVSDIPNSNFIRILNKDGKLYAGSNRGLFTLNAKEQWTEVPGLKNKVIYAIRQRSGDSMILGSPEGIFDESGRKLAGGDVRSFATLNRREYAAVFGRGVVDITGDAQLTVFDDQTANSLFEHSGKLWIGTAGNGLFSYDGTNVKTEAGPDVLKSGTIWNMFKTNSDGPLFIAGQHGVFAFQDGKIEQIVAVEDVRDVVEIDGQVWAATTTRGLLHTKHDERFGWIVSAIGFEQGLPSEKAFSIRPSGNKLIVATNRGIVTFKPGTIAPKLVPIRILSQRIHDLNEIRSTIILDHPQNSLLVDVAGQSSRTFPEEFQYGFVLTNAKGNEIDRRLSSESQYAPADLAPGEYTIEVIAFNRDLLASEPLFIKFSVARAPFPWTATALGILLFIAMIALIWAMIERRRIARRNRELAAARFDLANEAERERSRIARDLHDQTLADLRNLMMTSDRVLPGNREFRSEIESVSTEIRRICEDLSPSVLENVGLVAALEFLLGHTVKNYRFTAGETVEERIDFPLNVQRQVYRIAQEVLTNIARHSDATLVEMSVEITAKKKFRLTISDDGSQFQPMGSNNSGRGISNIRSRANIINSKIAWKKRPDRGNTFTLEIAGPRH